MAECSSLHTDVAGSLGSQSSSASCASQVSWNSTEDSVHAQHQSTPVCNSLAARRAFARKALAVSVSPIPAGSQLGSSAPPLFTTVTPGASVCPASGGDDYAPLTATHGWIQQCRGCGQRTGKTYTLSSCVHGISQPADIPFCSVCTKTLTSMASPERSDFEQQLVRVHMSWSRSGL